MLRSVLASLDGHYVGVSPQLLARVRQNWSALRLDLDAIWRDSIARLPGFRDLADLPRFPDSRPVDLLLLFDQGCCWVDTLRHVALRLAERGEPGQLTAAQVRGTAAVAARLRDEMAAVRVLAIEGLALPAMQIARTISEDVDLALVLLIRRKLAQQFVECRSPEEAAEFWRRHISGGGAFRLVAQALYRYGLDFSTDSEYARWRKEVLVFLGSVVHTSFASTPGGGADATGPLNPTAQECLYFATIRVQELCAYSLVLGADLRQDLGSLEAGDDLGGMRLRFARTGADIIVDQMRWLTEAGEGGAPRRFVH